MTPLLPSVSVGTVETRTVIEGIRSLIGSRVKFVEAYCVNVDLKAKAIICNTSVKEENVASSRLVKDSGREFFFRKNFYFV